VPVLSRRRSIVASVIMCPPQGRPFGPPHLDPTDHRAAALHSVGAFASSRDQKSHQTSARPLTTRDPDSCEPGYADAFRSNACSSGAPSSHWVRNLTGCRHDDTFPRAGPRTPHPRAGTI
jgi:hypothetical protein